MDLSSSLARGALAIVKTLRGAGHEAYFAGGCVRDFLLGRQPPDIDVATSAPPGEVSRLLPRVIPVGLKYGVVSVLQGDHAYEVATFRTDLGYRDGRHPEGVHFSDSRQDALRRDFTINGLFYDPVEGRVLDYVSGQEDLQRRIVRTIGDPRQRFAEDRLRLLRALRFACSLGFDIQGETFEVLTDEAHHILRVSWERIRDELLKMLTSPRPALALDLLERSGMLFWLLPEVAATSGVEQPPQFHPEGDVLTHTRLMLQELSSPTPTLALGVLLHDIGKPLTFDVQERIRFDLHVESGCLLADEICRRLRLSNDMTEQVVNLVRHHLRFMHVREMRHSTLKRFLRMEHFAEHLELHRLDCLASHRDLSNWEFCREVLESLAREPVAPEPLINGRDLIALGYRPGPLFGRILRAVEDAQLENTVATREEALRLVREQFPKETEPAG